VECLSVVACSRVIKTDLEMAVLRYANKISSDAHKKVIYLCLYEGECLYVHVNLYIGTYLCI